MQDDILLVEAFPQTTCWREMGLRSLKVYLLFITAAELFHSLIAKFLKELAKVFLPGRDLFSQR